MALNLSSYKQIQTNLFVKVVIPGYQTITFSDYHKNYTIDSVNFTGLGELLSITNTTSNLRAAPEELAISISGIPAGNISDFVGQKVKGSQVQVYRGFFDATTGELINISGNPAGKFYGVLNNFSVSDNLDDGGEGTMVVTFTCTSVIDQLNNKVAGRRTNPIDQAEFYPGDESFDRIPSLAKSNFNFGAPQ
jgi:hypothetical protein